MHQIIKILEPKLNDIMILFVDEYLLTEFRHENFNRNQIDDFKQAFCELAQNIITATGNLEESKYQKIVEINLQYGIPYVVVVNELGYIKDIFIHNLLEHKAVDGVIFLCKLFDALANNVANIYLKNYIKELYLHNRLRMSSLSEMKKNYISYYEGHLKWLNKLVNAMEMKDVSGIPELNPSLCVFGQWLQTDAKDVFVNEKKYNEVVTLHKTLHFMASKIEQMLITYKCDCHAGMIYLEKAELLSLEIGTELALLDNKVIMLKSSKDPLTGVLNRALLEQIFYDQYEFSFITDTSFVLAMCDLDHFKRINDEYGHSEGDFVLKLFAKTLKAQLRASDLIFRYGGDEFLIMLPTSNKQDAKKRFNKLSKIFSVNLKDYGKFNVDVTLSTGLLQITPMKLPCTEKSSFRNFIDKVDRALYKAKSNGRNCIEYAQE